MMDVTQCPRILGSKSIKLRAALDSMRKNNVSQRGKGAISQRPVRGCKVMPPGMKGRNISSVKEAPKSMEGEETNVSAIVKEAPTSMESEENNVLKEAPTSLESEENNVLSVKDEIPISMKSEETNVSSVKEVPISMKSEEVSQENVDPIPLGSMLSEIDIPTLTEENYETWKEKMENFLKSERLWDHVDEEKSPPCRISEFKRWKLNRRVSRLIRSKCGARTLPYTDGLDTPQVWSQLVTMYGFTYPTKTTGKMTKSTNYTWCLPFYRDIIAGNRKTISQFLSDNKGALTARLTSSGDLPLHVAVQNGKVKIVKELITNMPTNLLSEKGKDGRTVLHIAAVGGKIEIVKAIVAKDEKLVMIKSKYYSGCIPIMVAAEAGNKDVVNYLYPITISQEGNQKEGHNDEREKTKATILTSLIFGDFYGLALDLLKKYPHLLLTKDDFKLTAMEVLAMKHSAFQSSLPTKRNIATLGYSFLNLLLDIHLPENGCWRARRRDEENSLDASGDSSNDKPMFGPISNYPQLLWLRFCRLLQNALIKFVPGCRYICDEKLKHYGASKLVKEVWRVISQHDDLQSVKDVVVTAMFIATRNGIVEFIEECINNCPQLLMNKGEKYNSQTIFHYAISNRQEKIFGLMHHLGPLKHDLAMMTDASENCMSHLVATEIPIERLNQVPGAALQMQRELLWYKEVGSIMPSAHELFENKDQKTPRVLFTENHKELVKDGAAWMKDTATQCMVVATLITTVMFAAVFTVPGHTGGGEPNNYIQGKFPIVFVISNILALCSSVASMLMFLAIITSRYAEEDFLSTLPRMLMLGLFFLFISIVGMMIAFVAAALFMLHYNRLWVSFPIVSLSSIPIIIYASVEFPLFVQLMFATSPSDVFGKRSK